MRWREGRTSDNVEDRRGMRIPGGMAGLGLGGLLLAVVAAFFGVDPRTILGLLDTSASSGAQTAPAPPADDEIAQFVAAVLADTEDVWRAQFSRMGKKYDDPKLVLFSDRVESACGLADAAVGPFYCPGDHKVYLDLTFFEDLRRRFGAPGDFAQAYVIAHEIGHHVQNLLGTFDRVNGQRGSVDEAEANQLSVRLELQADFLAGVWAHHAERMRRILEPGDVNEALNAASQIGDDRLQRRAGGQVTPDSFTHGTSEQRARWFRLGFETGDVEKGDTFGARRL